MSRLCFALIAAVFALAACSQIAAGASVTVSAKAVQLARHYLESTDAVRRQQIAQQLDVCREDPEAVVAVLRPRPSADFKAGLFEKESFQAPELRTRHPDARLYYLVPDSYCPKVPTGLLVMMHGGGADPLEKTQTAPKRYMTAFGELFRKSDMITVAPSAPFVEGNSARWCLPQADDYLRDVIAEFQARFNIDADRVILMGYSMGGYGAYHQVQRQPDRFAAVMACAGGWRLAYWPVIVGTPLWMVHGAHDADPVKRQMHTTDVWHARLADQLLARYGIEHAYREHPGGHDRKDALKDIGAFLALAAKVRRDPYYPRAVSVSRRGWTSNDRHPARHNRWVTILEELPGKIRYDAAVTDLPANYNSLSKEEQYKVWKLKAEPLEREGAVVDATNRGGNLFEVKTQHVCRFALWLHPKMVDFSRPVRVLVDGQEAFRKIVKPSISAALRSFERRQDWGLIYTAEIEVEVRP